MLFVRRCWPLFVFLLFGGCTPKNPAEPIQIAHLLPLTGPDMKAAEDARLGMLLAVEEINADDKRIGGRTVVVRNVDTRGDSEVAQAEAVRLVTLNKVVAFVAGPDGRTAERLARTAQSYSIPIVVPGDFPPGTGIEGVVSLNAPPAQRGELLARYALKELKAKRAVILTDQRDPIAVELATAFVKEWPRTKPPSLEERPFRNDTELGDILASSLPLKEAAVVLFAGSPAGFLKAMEQQKKSDAILLYGGPDVGAGSLQQPNVEVLTATVFAPDGFSDKGKDFARRYEERFQEPPSFAATQAYDAGRLLFEVMILAKTSSPARVREELLRLETFESITGTVTWKDRQTRRPVFLVRVKNGEATVVKTVNPEEK